jgi:hypothetical protein
MTDFEEWWAGQGAFHGWASNLVARAAWGAAREAIARQLTAEAHRMRTQAERLNKNGAAHGPDYCRAVAAEFRELADRVRAGGPAGGAE